MEGNTYKITEDATGMYSKDSYVNMVINAGGSIVDTYDGWTLTTFNSQYMAYCENSGIVYGVLGPQRSIVEAIASSMTF